MPGRLRIALLAAFGLLLGPGLPAAPPLWTDQNIPPHALQELIQSQDEALDLQYDQSLALIHQAQAEAPGHPLCDLFLVATLLAQTQDAIRAGAKGVPPQFFAAADRLIAAAQAEVDAYPENPDAKVYLGAGYGMKGLAKLSMGSYLASYFDGKKGAALLKESVKENPGEYNAYMGLGQFEFYCGTLSGVLQFVLALPGDPQKGLDMLKTCQEKGTYACRPCEAYRVELMTGHFGDYRGAEPDLLDLVRRYPDNPDYCLGLFKALDAGVRDAAMREAARAALARLDAGGTLPSYERADTESLRFTLAKADLAAGATADAQPLLARLAGDPSPWPDKAKALVPSHP